MGKRGHLPPPLWNVVKCFCALVVTAKRSVDELYMHYFHNVWGGGKVDQTHTGALSLDPMGHFYRQTPNLPTPGKNPAGAHVPWEFLFPCTPLIPAMDSVSFACDRCTMVEYCL